MSGYNDLIANKESYIKNFNKEYDGKELLRLASSKNWKQFDQDLFNYLCQHKLLILDACWNFLEDIYGTYQNLPKKLFLEFVESEKNPKIIHFAGSRKPWIKIDSKYNKEFWRFAEKTPFLNELKSLENND